MWGDSRNDFSLTPQLRRCLWRIASEESSHGENNSELARNQHAEVLVLSCEREIDPTKVTGLILNVHLPTLSIGAVK